MQSSNGVEDNITKIAQLFPDCVTETVDAASGQPKHLIDFEKLKQNLSDSVMSEKAERYQFTWPDKSKAILLANSPINATLRPCREESVDFDHTQNIYIEGDNLDVLKCLKETYLHKVKMIYIDPPYNTGNDFVYEDDFAQSSADYLANSGQYDEQGNRMFTNAESNGRFHTDWLNMIYPRLKVARDLLTDDGVIFISIDDNEVENLRKVCDEVFGESNFIAQFIWKKKQGGGNDSSNVVAEHEYIICFAKNITKVALGLDKQYKLDSKLYPFKDEKGDYGLITLDKASIQFSQSLVFEIKDKDGNTYYPRIVNGKQSCWRWSKKKVENEFDELVFKNGKVYTKYYKPDGVTPRSLLMDSIYGRTESGNDDIKALFNPNPFSYPKPIALVKHFASICSKDKDSLILDFFSGSATTAHAVMQLNAEDGGNRKFIMVQLPELTYTAKTEKYMDGREEKERYIIDEETGRPAIAKDSDARKAGYYTICEIGKERIRRAGKKIKAESPLTTQDLDIGFRVLKLDSTNMEDIYYSPKDINQADLFTQVDNVKPDRTGEDLLFQVMLELGATLDSKIETTTVADKTIYNVAENYLVACFDRDVSDEVVKAIAQMQPMYAVLRDTSMKSDATATNFEQIFKTYSPQTVTRIL